MRTRYDAIIVGAGPTGTTTALLLARAGLEVLVVAARRGGTEPVHVPTRIAGTRLRRLGLLESVRTAGTPAITADLIAGAGPVESLDRSDEPVYAPRRGVLDPILVSAARQAGARIRLDAVVHAVVRNFDDRVVGVAWHEVTSGASGWAYAPIVIGADGPESTIAAAVRPRTRHLGVLPVSIVTRYWTGLPADQQRWHYRDGRFAGVVPTNYGQACVWVAVRGAEFAAEHGSTLGRHYRQVVADVAPGLDLDERAARGPVRSYPLIRGAIRESAGPGWALVGSAGWDTDPVVAPGPVHTWTDVELLAEAIVTAAGSADRTDRALRDYEHARDELALPVLRASDRIASGDWEADEFEELLAGLAAAGAPGSPPLAA